jgi:hypothetical protein
MRRVALAVLLLGLFGVRPVDSAPPAPPPTPHGVLGVYVRGPDRLQAGTPAALRIATHFATSETVSGPFQGVEIEVRLSGKDRAQMLFHGRTDTAGLVDARFLVPAWPDGSYTMTVDATAGARHPTETHAVELVPSSRLLLESDKPLYQPAQTIHLRTIGLRPLDGKPLDAGEVTFTLVDPRGNEVFRQGRPLSRFGVAAVDVPLADEILTGPYRARVELGGGASTELPLSIERYVLPKFKVGVEADRTFYRPGDTAQITLEARYFFGKPVAGGRATVHARVVGRDSARVELTTAKATLDADGKARLRVELPASLAMAEGSLVLQAEVVDSADHREEGARELPCGTEAVRLELTPDGRELVPGARNRVWLAATRPDGAPLADAEVELMINGASQPGRTDAIGVAQFLVEPVQNGRSACGFGQIELAAAVRHDGVRSLVHRCERLAPVGTLLLRTDRAIYGSGAAMQVELAGLGPDGIAYLDVIKDGQTVDTARVTMKGGAGRVTLPADARRFGTLSLEAYRIAPDGTRKRSARLVYVERPAALKVEVRTDASYRPGETGRIRVHVVDAHSGRGAQAEVGLVMVDQSLLALKAMKPGAARVYFTLADEATRPERAMRATPGGYTVEKLIEEGELDALKDEAARILLAGASAPWTLGWESDPWQQRKDARDAQLSRLAEKVPEWATKHVAGERLKGAHFRWRRDLLEQMLADGTLPARDTHDPWGRRVSTEKVIEASGLGDFDSWATAQVDERLTRIYVAVARAGLDSKLPADPAKKRAVVLTMADLEKLAADGKLPKWLLVDPWGQPWQIVEKKRAFQVARLRSRYLVSSIGPDGVPGTKDDLFAADASWGRPLSSLRVAAMPADALDSFGVGGLGLIGRGAGGGGFGSGVGYGHGSIALSGTTRSVEAGEARVRRDFPETMLWKPDLVTDENGDATLDVAMADSITTWRLFAEAIAADGRLGQAQVDVRVFQDFFVDLDLPPVLTQHDELSVPVAVYNYLSTPQRITLELADARWFTRTGEAVQSIDLQPSQVGVRYFRIRALGVGRQKLLVHARGTTAADAVEKSVEIRPDGVERAVAFQDRLEPGRVRHTFTLPDDAIADASVGTLKIYPSTATHVLEGLDSMLRLPGGCFEQTSSTTYPNALILDYLRRTRKATPEVEKKARDYLALGWQRLVSFEVPGGGFSWFGQAPANQILTAYGLQEFHDMARVYPIDRRVIERTQAWLVGRQKPDGSWTPDTSFINEGATNHFNSDVVRITAYIAVALEHTGHRGPAIDRAREFVRRSLDDKRDRDPYTLALAAELFAHSSTTADTLLSGVLDELWRERTDAGDGKTTSFAPREKTPTHGDGKSATVETTALAAWSMLQSKAPLDRVDRAIGYLLSAKDTFGNWYSTQATILSLKALLAYGGAIKPARGTLTVTVDGSDAAALTIDAARLGLTALDLPQLTRPGRHAVSVRFDGAGQLAYQIVGRWFEPRTVEPPPKERPKESEELEITAALSRGRLRAGEEVVETVRARARVAVDMPMVVAALPPGFDVDGAELEKLVAAHAVDKVQRTADGVLLYLTRLDPAKEFRVDLHLRARFPERVLLPASRAYEYYRPERQAASVPRLVEVEG